MTQGCDKTLLLQAEFDGELDAAESAALAAHRAQCADCAETWRTLGAVRAAMDGAPRYEASAALRLALERRFRPEAVPARGALWRWRREALAFAAGAAVAASLAIFLPSGGQGVVVALVDDHVRSLQPGHLEDVVSTDQHTVKPWFDGRLDFAPPVKDLAQAGFPLKGGRLDYLDGRAVAALVYEHGKHLINLFVWPDRAAAAAALDTERNGYNVVHWTQGGMEFWAVSDVERAQLEEFAADWRRAG